MQDVKPVIAHNISELRVAAGMTQIELAERLNYSDKAVSKWERGESVPDISVLMQIAELFGVTVDYLVSAEHEQPPDEEMHADDKAAAAARHRRHVIITELAVLLVLFIATVAFVIIDMASSTHIHWLAFIYAVPVSMIVWLIFNSIWFNKRLNYLIISILVWSLLGSVYLSLLPFGINLWQVFIPGIPGQVIIFIWSRLTGKGRGK